jgi:flagellar hook-basal body complex protein FliE
MKILNAPVNIAPLKTQESAGEAAVAGDQAFGQFLKDALQEVNNLQIQSRDTKQQLLTGNVEDLHQVMIAGEKANVALQMTVQIRNKVIEAYQEIMRMQV